MWYVLSFNSNFWGHYTQGIRVALDIFGSWRQVFCSLHVPVNLSEFGDITLRLYIHILLLTSLHLSLVVCGCDLLPIPIDRWCVALYFPTSLTFSIAWNMYLVGVSLGCIIPKQEFIIWDEISGLVVGVEPQPYTLQCEGHVRKYFIWPFSKSHGILIEIVGLLKLWYWPMLVSVGIEVRWRGQGLFTRGIYMLHLVQTLGSLPYFTRSIYNLGSSIRGQEPLVDGIY